MLPHMDGEGVNPRIISHERGGAITLMSIRIHDHNLDPWALQLHIPNGNSDVVEDTVALPMITESMVISSRKTDRNAVLQSGVASLASRLSLCGAPLKEASIGR